MTSTGLTVPSRHRPRAGLSGGPSGTPLGGSPTHTGQRDTVELVPSELLGFVTVVARPVLGGSKIELDLEAALGQVLRHEIRLHPERESLAGLLERREQIPRAAERCRPGEDIAMHGGGDQDA